VDVGELMRALALVLVLEGLMPFLAPARWREALLRITSLQDRQLRSVGFVLILIGVIALNLL
jgi:uncharacterized protein YjeT (DUF2065 family)